MTHRQQWIAFQCIPLFSSFSCRKRLPKSTPLHLHMTLPHHPHIPRNKCEARLNFPFRESFWGSLRFPVSLRWYCSWPCSTFACYAWTSSHIFLIRKTPQLCPGRTLPWFQKPGAHITHCKAGSSWTLMGHDRWGWFLEFFHISKIWIRK